MTTTNDAQTTIATGDTLDVRRFSLRQAMSELFTIELTVVSRNADIDMDEVIGAAADFTLITKEGAERWAGVCREMEQTRVEAEGLATYRLVLVPSAWMLTQRKNYRIFQYQSELEIAQAILLEWGVEHEVRVDQAAHKARKLRVQYGESDFTFVSRLLEDAGVSYYFEASRAGTKLVLDDAPESRAVTAPLLTYHDEPGRNDGRFVTHVSVGARLRPGAMRVGDVDYRRPSTNQPVKSARTGLPQETALEQFDFDPGAFLFTALASGHTPSADDRGVARTDDVSAGRKTTNRLLGHRNDAKVVSLESDVISLVPGTILSVAHHPHPALVPSNSLLVTRATLEGSHEGEWRVSVSAAPTSTPYRPALRTPRPRVEGLESATVVGPAGEEIHTDEFARVRVHFHWDRESRHDEKSSCWLPTSQPWAGRGFGAVNLPRIGQEVLVQFLGGDPDRPVVVGRVYTEANPPPDALPRYKHVSGFMTESTPRLVMGAAGGSGATSELSPLGGRPLSPGEIHGVVTQPGPFQAASPTGTNHHWRGSGMRLDDMSGAENLYIQANRDFHMVVWRNCTTVVGNHRATKIGTDDITRVDGAQAIRIDSEQRTEVRNDCKTRVDRKRTDKVGVQLKQESRGDVVVESRQGNLVIGAKRTIRFESDDKIQFQAADEAVGGPKSLVQITPNDISFLAGANKIELNPRGSKQPSTSVRGMSLTPAELEERRREAAEAARLAAVGRPERLALGREVVAGLPSHWRPSPAGGENSFAREALRQAGITQRGEQDQILQEYFDRDKTDMR